MNILFPFSLGLWMLYYEVTDARYPNGLSISGEDFKFVLKWKISEIPEDKGTKNETGKVEDEEANKMHERSGNETFTVFQWGTNVTGDDDDFTIHEVWTKIKGCDRVYENECNIEELLEYDEEFTFWVTDSTADTSVSIKDINPAQILDYIPGEKMTFSPPNFSATRKQNKLFINFHPKNIDVWGVNQTIPEYLHNRLFDPIYTIYYYQVLEKNNATLAKNQGPIESMRNYKIIPADVSNVTITNSIPPWAKLCISIRFINDEITKESMSSFSTKCLLPEVSTMGNDENRLVSNGNAVNWLYVLFAVTFIAFIAIVVQCCRKGPRAIKKIFSIQPIQIPDVTNDIIKEEPKSKPRLIFNGVSDDGEVVDIIEPPHNEDDVFHFRSCFPSNAEPKQERLSSDCDNLLVKKSQRYEAVSTNAEHDLQESQQNLSCSPDVPSPSPKKLAEDYLDMSSPPKVIVFEHLLGPYIADCIWNANDESRPISPPNKSKIQKKESTQDQTTICLESKALRMENRRKVPKQRFLSEDSAFYDDFHAGTSNGKGDACYD